MSDVLGAFTDGLHAGNAAGLGAAPVRAYRLVPDCFLRPCWYRDRRRVHVTRRQRYGVFGHSAGSQFVHRKLSLGLRSKVQAAVAANAGTYAMPNLLDAWPYGLADTPLDAAGLEGMLGFRLTVMAGTADIDASSLNFPKEPVVMLQGGTRYARAHSYIAAAHAEAQARGTGPRHQMRLDDRGCGGGEA